LLGDRANTAKEWSKLSENVQEIVKREYPEEFAQILAAIANRC
jgi:predicted house-cleaning noncanonical NTP pyrophosphatase (MazG superfamily)